MDAVSSQLLATHAGLLHTVSLAVTDMAMAGSAEVMGNMVDMLQEATPPSMSLDPDVGRNIDVYA